MKKNDSQEKNVILRKRPLPESEVTEVAPPRVEPKKTPPENAAQDKPEKPAAEDKVIEEKTENPKAPAESAGKQPETQENQKGESAAEKPKENESGEEKQPEQEEPKPKTTQEASRLSRPIRTEEKIKGKRSSFLMIGVGQDRTYFVENLAMLLSAGMNIISALDSIKEGLKSSRMRKIVEEVKNKIDAGTPVWRALDDTGLLSAHYISLIKIGEESGRLPANLKIIAAQDQKERVFKSKVMSAMMYPVIVLFFTLVVGIGIAWFILPKLSGVFKSLNLKLPVTTKVLLTFGDFLGKNGTVVVPAFFVALIIIFYFVFYFPKTKIIGQKIIFHIPGVKTLVQQIELSRLGFILGTLLSAGMPLVNALESLEEVSSFRDYKRFYQFLRKNVEEGNSFRKCFIAYRHSNRLIPYPVQQMIVAAEQSGNLKSTLKMIGENFEEKTDISTKNLSVILEPILLFVIWVVVLFVALSVIMPIYSLIGGINK